MNKMYSDEQILEKTNLLLEELDQNLTISSEKVLREISDAEYGAIEDILEDMKGEDIAFNDLFQGETRKVIDFPGAVDTTSELGRFVDFFDKQEYKVDWEKGMVSAERRVSPSLDDTVDMLMGRPVEQRKKKIQMKIGKLFSKIRDLQLKREKMFYEVIQARLNKKYEEAVKGVPEYTKEYQQALIGVVLPPRSLARARLTGNDLNSILNDKELETWNRLNDTYSLYVPNPGYLAPDYDETGNEPKHAQWPAKMASYWQEHAGYIKDEFQNMRSSQYSIILTRDPIDILRMSDFDKITSCHSPPSRGGGQQTYYKCAVAEAQGHGAVAYVVNTEDLLHATNTGNIESAQQEIQEGELFADEARAGNHPHHENIEPISRVRLRQMRYFDWEKYDAGEDDGTEVAVPENRVYGVGIPGFVDRVVKWARENQEEVISNMPRSGGKVDLDDFKIFGGSSEDTSRKTLLAQLTGLSLGDFTGEVTQDTETEDNLPENWVGDLSAEWERECEDIKNEWNERYAAAQVDFRIEEDYDGGFYIMGSARLIIEWDLDDWNQLPNSYPMGPHLAAEINEYYGDIFDDNSGFINKKDHNMVRWGCDVNLAHPAFESVGDTFFDPSAFNEMCAIIDVAIDDKRNAFEEIAEKFFKREGVMSGGLYMDLTRKIENNEIGSYEWDVEYDGDYDESYEAWATISYDFDPEALGIEPRILFDLVDRREFALLLRGYLTGPAREETGSEYWLSIRDKSAVEVGGEIRYQITFKVDADTPDDLVTQFYELVTGDMDDEDEITKAFLGALNEEAKKNGVNLAAAEPEKERNWDNLNDLGENKKHDSNYWVKRWKMNF